MGEQTRLAFVGWGSNLKGGIRKRVARRRWRRRPFSSNVMPKLLTYRIKVIDRKVIAITGLHETLQLGGLAAVSLTLALANNEHGSEDNSALDSEFCCLFFFLFNSLLQ